MKTIHVLLISLMLMLSISTYSQAINPMAFNDGASTIESFETDPLETSNLTQIKKDKTKKDKIHLDSNFYYSLLINMLAVSLLILAFHYRNYHKQDVFFTYFIFNITIFLLTYLLNEIKISMGAAFGLFAVFSMLRYRTEGISMKDMTYLFMVIAMGLIAAVQLDMVELIIIDLIIIAATFLLEGNLFIKPLGMKRIRYDNIELVKPQYAAELLDDLQNRTGLDIVRVEIKDFNFLKDTARLIIFYKL